MKDSDAGADRAEIIAAFNRSTHEALESQPKIGWGEKFRFRCHSGLDCWTDCCHETNLFLTPYDVIRLKRRLKLDSASFLNSMTVNLLDPTLGAPVVRLKMEPESGACPFVGRNGCSVYEDRPTSCRLYPFGLGSSSGTDKARAHNLFFKIEDDFCHGWSEPTEWKLESWTEDQGVIDYNFHNQFLVGLIFHPRFKDEIDERSRSMLFMALYDLDRFRAFVFETTFLEKFRIEPDLLERAKVEDEALLMISARWIEFFLFGLKTLELKQSPGQAEADTESATDTGVGVDAESSAE